MKRGPKPRPTIQVPADVQSPPPPAWLSEQAMTIWYETSEALREHLTVADANALARYCDLQADYERMSELPLVQAAQLKLRISVQLLDLEKQLGLTPTARKRMGVQGEIKRRDEREEFFE